MDKKIYKQVKDDLATIGIKYVTNKVNEIAKEHLPELKRFLFKNFGVRKENIEMIINDVINLNNNELQQKKAQEANNLKKLEEVNKKALEDINSYWRRDEKYKKDFETVKELVDYVEEGREKYNSSYYSENCDVPYFTCNNKKTGETSDLWIEIEKRGNYRNWYWNTKGNWLWKT